MSLISYFIDRLTRRLGTDLDKPGAILSRTRRFWYGPAPVTAEQVRNAFGLRKFEWHRARDIDNAATFATNLALTLCRTGLAFNLLQSF